MAMPVQRTTENLMRQPGERQDTQHQQFADRINKDSHMQSQQVQQSPKAEDAMIRRDGRGNGGAGAGKNKKKKAEAKAKSDATSGRTGSGMLDIMI
jgi:hypothetical protein